MKNCIKHRKRGPYGTELVSKALPIFYLTTQLSLQSYFSFLIICCQFEVIITDYDISLKVIKWNIQLTSCPFPSKVRYLERDRPLTPYKHRTVSPTLPPAPDLFLLWKLETTYQKVISKEGFLTPVDTVSSKNIKCNVGQDQTVKASTKAWVVIRRIPNFSSHMQSFMLILME